LSQNIFVKYFGNMFKSWRIAGIFTRFEVS